MKVLLIEGAMGKTSSLCSGLLEAGYQVEMAPSLKLADEALQVRRFDLILLTVTGVAELGSCRQWRAQGLNAPILVLSALGSTEDRVSGLDAGADDYLTIPFAFEELSARIRALLRPRFDSSWIYGFQETAILRALAS